MQVMPSGRWMGNYTWTAESGRKEGWEGSKEKEKNWERQLGLTDEGRKGGGSAWRGGREGTGEDPEEGRMGRIMIININITPHTTHVC